MRKGWMRKLIAFALVLAMSVPASLGDITEDVKVAKAEGGSAISSASIIANYDPEIAFYYTDGEAPTLTASYTVADGYSVDETKTTYQWYQGSKYLSGATEKNYKAKGLNAGTYTFSCEILVETTSGDKFKETPISDSITINPKEVKSTNIVWDVTNTYTKDYDGTTDCNTVSAHIAAGFVSSGQVPISGSARYQSANAGDVQVVYSPDEVTSGNYTISSSISKTYTGRINKVKPLTPSAPEVLSKTDTGVTLKAATTPLFTSSSVLLNCIYGYKIDGDAGTDYHWQSSPIFSGLTRNKKYYFYQMTNPDIQLSDPVIHNNTKASDVSTGTEVTTDKTNLSTATLSFITGGSAYASIDYNGIDNKTSLDSDLTVKIGTETVENSQYDISYYKVSDTTETPVTEIINAGSYRVKISAKAGGDFEGEKSIDFTVNRYNINGSKVVISQSSDLFYTGVEPEPQFSVKFSKADGSEENVNYELSDIQQPSGSVGTNGKAKMTASGVNFTGTINEVPFTVKQKLVQTDMFVVTASGLSGDNVLSSGELTDLSKWYRKIVITPASGYSLYEVADDNVDKIPTTGDPVNSIVYDQTKEGLTKYFYLKNKTNKYIYSFDPSAASSATESLTKGRPMGLTFNIDVTAPSGSVQIGLPGVPPAADRWSDLWDTLPTISSVMWLTRFADKIRVSGHDNIPETSEESAPYGDRGLANIFYFIDNTGAGKTSDYLKNLQENANATLGWAKYFASGDAASVTDSSDFDSMPSIVSNKKQVVYVKLVDKVGNTEYISTELLQQDDTPPTFPEKVTVSEKEQNNPYADPVDFDATVTVTANDETGGSGVFGYQLYFSTGSSLYDGTKSVSENITNARTNGSRAVGLMDAEAPDDHLIWSSEGSFSLDGLSPNTRYYYVVIARDNAGNESIKNAQFDTKRLSLTKATVTLKQNSFIYTGREIKPEIESVKLTVGGIERDIPQIEDGEYNYVISYKSNVYAGNPSSDNKPTLIISETNTGGYSGEREVNFTITPYNIAETDVAEADKKISVEVGELYYTGEPLTPSVVANFKFSTGSYVTMTTGSSAISTGSSYTVSSTVIQPTDGGGTGGVGSDGRITLNGAANFTGARDVSFSVKQKQLTDAMYNVTKYIGSPNGDIATDSALEWYKSVVIEPKSGYKLYRTGSATEIPASGSFVTGIVMNTTGEDKTEYFYVVDSDGRICAVSDGGNVLKKGNAKDIVADIDATAPSGTVQIRGEFPSGSSTRTPDSRVWEGFRAVDTDKDADAFLTRSKDKIELTLTDEHSSKDGVGAKIEYYISDQGFKTVKDLLDYMTANSKTWTVYDKDNKPFIKENQVQVIYARLTDAAGNISYAASGKIRHDSTPPVLTTPVISDQTINGATITVKATDEYGDGKEGSGTVKYWLKYDVTEATGHGYSYQDIINGNLHKEPASPGESVQFQISHSSILPNSYCYYSVFAEDKAGNVSSIGKYEFLSAKRSIENASLTLEYNSKEYTGENIRPGVINITFTDGITTSTEPLGDLISSDDDTQTYIYGDASALPSPIEKYKVVYDNNKDVSSLAKVTVTALDAAPVTGEKDAYFSITPYDIGKPKVKVTDLKGGIYYYTGEAITPALKLEFEIASGSSYEMKLNRDFTYQSVTQPANSAASDRRGVGEDGLVVIKGMGNFSERTTREQEFSVLQNQIYSSMYIITKKDNAKADYTTGFVTGQWYTAVMITPDNGYTMYDGSNGITSAGNVKDNLPDKESDLRSGEQTIAFYFKKDSFIFAESMVSDALKPYVRGKAKQLVVKIDKDKPSGMIKVGDRSWDVNYYPSAATLNPRVVHTLDEITITASDEHSGIVSGQVKYLIGEIGDGQEQLVGDEKYIENILGKETGWRVYDPENKPKLLPNKSQVVYVKLVDNVGNTRYLSTDVIKNDTTLADAEITLDKDELSYSGVRQRPNITVKLGDTTLREDTDYTVSYISNDGTATDGTITSSGTKIGEVTLEIKGAGSYKGTRETKYTIIPKQILAKLTGRTSKVYDGKADCDGGNFISGEAVLAYELTDVFASDSALVQVDKQTEGKTPTLLYETSDSGEDLTVQASGVFLTGSAAKNYQLIGDTGSGGIATGAVGTIVKATPTITFTSSSYVKTYEKGGSFSIAGEKTYDGDGSVLYTVTSGSDVISVENSGLIKIKKVGTAKITVTASEGRNYKKIESTDPGKVELTIIINKSKTPPSKPGDTLPVGVSVATIGDAALPEGWTWVSSESDITDEERLAAETRETAKPGYVSGGVWFVSAATAFIPESSSNVYSVAYYATEDHEEDNYEPDSCRVLINIIKADHDHVAGEILYTGTYIDSDGNVQPEKPPTCEEPGHGHRECTFEGCAVILESNILVDPLGHDMQWHGTPAQVGVDGVEYMQCERCGYIDEETRRVIPRITPAPVPTRTPAHTPVPVPTSPGGGGGGGGGGGSGGGGGGGGGSVPIVSGSPLPSGAPTIAPVPTIQPSITTAPAPTVAPGTPAPEPTSSGSVNTTVDTKKDSSGNILSVVTTTTEVKNDGSSSTTVTTEYTDGRSTLEITKTAKNGDVTTIVQETQKNGDYVKVTTVEPANGSAPTVVYTKSTNNITSVSTYKVTPGGDLEIISSGTDMATEKLVIPDTIASNGRSIPITSIQKKAFKGRTKLVSVAVGNKVTDIGSGAFAKTGLKKATLGTAVERLGSNVFKGARNLKNITVYSRKLASIGKNAFSGIAANATISIAGTKKQFKKIRNMIRASGAPKGVKYKRI